MVCSVLTPPYRAPVSAGAIARWTKHFQPVSHVPIYVEAYS